MLLSLGVAVAWIFCHLVLPSVDMPLLGMPSLDIAIARYFHHLVLLLLVHVVLLLLLCVAVAWFAVIGVAITIAISATSQCGKFVEH